MGLIFSGLWQDPVGVLMGQLRRLTLRSGGYPRRNDTAMRLEESARAVRYIPAQLDALIRDYPRYPQPLFELALVREEEQDWAAVLETGEFLIRRFGGHFQSYHIACLALRQLRRLDEAEALAIRAIRRFPDCSGGWAAYAAAAHDRGNWPETERRWGMVARRFPNVMWPRLMHATARMHVGDVAGADRLLQEMALDYPQEWWVLYHGADVAARLGDPALAPPRWEALVRAFPGRTEAHVQLIRAQLRAGDVAGAAERAANAVFMFPRDAQVLGARDEVVAAGGTVRALPKG